MKIVAKNGVDGFKTIEECLEYEEALDAAEREKEAKAEALKKEYRDRYTEIEKLYADVIEKSRAFEKDYGVRIVPWGSGKSCFYRI